MKGKKKWLIVAVAAVPVIQLLADAGVIPAAVGRVAGAVLGAVLPPQ